MIVDSSYAIDALYVPAGGGTKLSASSSGLPSLHEPEPPSSHNLDDLWKEFSTEDGQVYFFNEVTQESSWSRPQVEVTSGRLGVWTPTPPASPRGLGLDSESRDVVGSTLDALASLDQTPGTFFKSLGYEDPSPGTTFEEAADRSPVKSPGFSPGPFYPSFGQTAAVSEDDTKEKLQQIEAELDALELQSLSFRSAQPDTPHSQAAAIPLAASIDYGSVPDEGPEFPKQFQCIEPEHAQVPVVPSTDQPTPLGGPELSRASEDLEAEVDTHEAKVHITVHHCTYRLTLLPLSD